MMSKSLLPTSARRLMPMILPCPLTVRPTTDSDVYPSVGAVLVSPDQSTGPTMATHPARAMRPLPTLSRRNPNPQAIALAARSTVASSEGPISLAPRCSEHAKAIHNGLPPPLPLLPSGSSGTRLNKFVRRLHGMLQAEKDSGIVEWRRGLLVLHSTDAFAKTILPKYFNTRNFKTFRRQLNYYGFVHVRSFSTTGSTTTALWVNRDLAKQGSTEISSVLLLKRVEPEQSAKTAEGRRVRKEMAIFTVEEDIGVSPKTLQMEQIRSLAEKAGVQDLALDRSLLPRPLPAVWPPIPTEVLCHHSPASLPLPLFPKFSELRQVSPTLETNEDPAIQQVAPSQAVRVCSAPEKSATVDAVADVGAANLLLMLSRRARTKDVPSAIAPGQVLM